MGKKSVSSVAPYTWYNIHNHLQNCIDLKCLKAAIKIGTVQYYKIWLLYTMQNIIYKIMNDVTIISIQHVHCIM